MITMRECVSSGEDVSVNTVIILRNCGAILVDLRTYCPRNNFPELNRVIFQKIYYLDIQISYSVPFTVMPPSPLSIVHCLKKMHLQSARIKKKKSWFSNESFDKKFKSHQHSNYDFVFAQPRYLKHFIGVGFSNK